jgi:hypothetical protein
MERLEARDKVIKKTLITRTTCKGVTKQHWREEKLPWPLDRERLLLQTLILLQLK